MLLRRMMAALGPLVLCILTCSVFRLLDGWLGSSDFWGFAARGAVLGAALAFVLPCAGVRAHTTGLTSWMLLGAFLMLAVIVYQYLEATGELHWPVLASMMDVNGQVILVESAAGGYMTAAALWYRRR